jgi:hypothetical protein
MRQDECGSEDVSLGRLGNTIFFTPVRRENVSQALAGFLGLSSGVREKKPGRERAQREKRRLHGGQSTQCGRMLVPEQDRDTPGARHSG